MKKLLTIFTPTYNRADLLNNLYDSLKKQTSFNFIWMVIDDGSTDNTKEVVDTWKRECKDFEIEYYKKENGGLQSGYVEAIKHLETELAMCIDSDDYATPNAVELIENAWGICDHDKYAGLFGLDCYASGKILGGYFSDEQKQVNLIDLCVGKQIRDEADRALVIRSDLYKEAKPAKRYPGERTMNATYLHLQISEKYDFAILNAPLIVVNYQPDGLTKGKHNHYKNSPNSFADWRMYMFTLEDAPFKFYFRHAIHYVSSCMFAKRKIFVKECQHKGIVFLALPFGLALNIYLRRY
mgnify:CR=1 FL=1